MTTREEVKFVDPQSSTIPEFDYDSIDWNPPYEILNACVICGIDMGDCNPRQFCGKTHCLSPPTDKIASGEVDFDGYYIGLPLDENVCRVCGNPTETGNLCGLIYCQHTLDRLKDDIIPNSRKLQLIEEEVTYCAECGCDMGQTLDKLCGGMVCLGTQSE
jgi:hypothetical protein